MTIPQVLPRDPLNKWLDAFLGEWMLLAEGKADPHQVLDLAEELYGQNVNRDPVEVAREAWDAP